MADLNFQNRTLYHGDNLDFLRGMNSETVHLIATDPPFNKSRDFHATPDSLARGASFQDRWSWRDDIHDEWLLTIQRDHPDVWSVINTAKRVYGDDMGAFLCFMGVRLLEMHRVLREDGSLYLHIDHTAHAYVKALLDAIFGHRNFRNEIVWGYRGMPSKSASMATEARYHPLLHKERRLPISGTQESTNGRFPAYICQRKESRLQLESLKEDGDSLRLGEVQSGCREWGYPF